MTPQELFEEVHPVAARVARRVVRDFTGYIEQDDLYQDLIAWTLENERRVVDWLTPDEDDVEDTVDSGRRRLYTTFRRRARGVAHTAKADRLGYRVQDLHFYSTASIEELLPRIYNYEEWLPSASVETDHNKTDPALGGNMLALLCDVKRAYETGSDQDRLLLFTRYIDAPALDVEVMASDAGVGRRTMEKRIERALRRMNERLGDTRPQLGLHVGRHAVSNALAGYITNHPHDDLPATWRRM